MIEVGITREARLEPYQKVYHEILALSAREWQTAYNEGYIGEAGEVIPHNYRLKRNNGLLGGFNGVYRIAALEETASFFRSGGHNQCLDALGIEPLTWSETLTFLKRGAKLRPQPTNRQALRKMKTEPVAWISRNALETITRHPRAKLGTIAVYTTLCILAGEENEDSFDINPQSSAERFRISEKTYRDSLRLLVELRLIRWEKGKRGIGDRVDLLSVAAI